MDAFDIQDQMDRLAPYLREILLAEGIDPDRNRKRPNLTSQEVFQAQLAQIKRGLHKGRQKVSACTRIAQRRSKGR